LQDSASHLGDLLYLLPRDSWHRVEVNAQFVGMLQIFCPYRVRVQLQAAQVCKPGERRGVARHDLLGNAARGKGQLHHLDPQRAPCRGSLLVEVLAVDPVGIANEHVGAAASSTKRSIRHSQVVAHQIELGVLWPRKQQFVRIRDRHFAPAARDRGRTA